MDTETLLATVSALRAEVAELRARSDAHHAALLRLCHGEPQDLPEGNVSLMLMGEGWYVSAQSSGRPGQNYFWTAYRVSPAPPGSLGNYAATLPEAVEAVGKALAELAVQP